jgi:hypothetical protein
MKKEIVIAAYDKDLSWTESLNRDVSVKIYRKGTNLNNEKEIFIEKNIGRCVHTFFYHIFENYDNLSDYTFFVQDYPFDHWENVVEVVNGNHEDFIRNAQLTIGGYFGYHWNTIKFPCDRGGVMWKLSESTQHKNGNVLICSSNGFPQDNNPNINVNKYWEILFENNPPQNFEFMPGGHFGVTKEHIRTRSREFYEKIVNILVEDEFAPWGIERLECYIFNPNFEVKF